MLTSNFLITLSYFFHLVATVAWIGGLVILAFVVQPAIDNVATEPKERVRLIETIQKRFQPIANISLIVLVLTGMVQTFTNRSYSGFLRFDSTWAQAILFKHIAVLGMIVLAGIITFSVQPALRRNALLAANGVIDEAQSVHLQKQQTRLTQINLVLSLVVLVFTAIARAQ